MPLYWKYRFKHWITNITRSAVQEHFCSWAVSCLKCSKLGNMVCCAGPSFSLQLNISNIYSIDRLKKCNTILKQIQIWTQSIRNAVFFRFLFLCVIKHTRIWNCVSVDTETITILSSCLWNYTFLAFTHSFMEISEADSAKTRQIHYR